MTASRAGAGWKTSPPATTSPSAAAAPTSAPITFPNTKPIFSESLTADGTPELAYAAPLSSRAAVEGPPQSPVLECPRYVEIGSAFGAAVPEILYGDRESVRAFLRGYFDGTGIANPNVACEASSHVIAEQIQQLLLGLGVFCGIDTRKVTIYDVEAFELQVGFTRLGRVKDRFYDNTPAQKRNPNFDVVPGAGALIRELAQQIPSKYRSDDFRTMSAYYDRTGWRRPSYHLLRRWLAAAPDCAGSR